MTFYIICKCFQHTLRLGDIYSKLSYGLILDDRVILMLKRPILSNNSWVSWQMNFYQFRKRKKHRQSTSNQEITLEHNLQNATHTDQNSPARSHIKNTATASSLPVLAVPRLRGQDSRNTWLGSPLASPVAALSPVWPWTVFAQLAEWGSWEAEGWPAAAWESL